jgi:acyl carrier protein
MARMITETAPMDGIRDLLRTRVPRARDLGDLPDDLPLGEGGLGLDSIGLVELLLECEQRFRLPPLLTLLDGPPLTVGLLADHVRASACR